MLQFPASLSAEKYLSYVESFGTTSRRILEPYRDAARQCFTMREAAKIILLEIVDRRQASHKNFNVAAETLTKAMEKTLAKTFDLVPTTEWQRTLPDLGSDKELVMAVLTGFPNLTRLFKLAA